MQDKKIECYYIKKAKNFVSGGSDYDVFREDETFIDAFNSWREAEDYIHKIGGELITLAEATPAFPEDRIEKGVVASDFERITSSICKVITEKNKRYGNSALQPLEVFAGKAKVGTRIDDKLARIKNSDELRKNDVGDLIGYLILVCVEKGYTDFTDQID